MESGWIIVDSTDKELGIKPRGTLQVNDIYRVSALWVTNSQGDALLAQRKWTKKHDPGKWGPAVAGTVEQGETYESNIYKEAEEEIGLKGVSFTLGQKIFNDGQYRFFCQWYQVVVDKEASAFKPQEEEIEALAWYPHEQLVKELEEKPDKFLPGAEQWLRLF